MKNDDQASVILDILEFTGDLIILEKFSLHKWALFSLLLLTIEINTHWQTLYGKDGKVEVIEFNYH